MAVTRKTISGSGKPLKPAGCHKKVDQIVYFSEKTTKVVNLVEINVFISHFQYLKVVSVKNIPRTYTLEELNILTFAAL